MTLLSMELPNFANVSRNRLLTRAALIRAATARERFPAVSMLLQNNVHI